MSLNNPDNINTLSVSGKTNDLMVDRLTFEPSTKSMYWINHSNSTNSTIERFDIGGGNLDVITADATHVSGIHLYITSSLHHHYSIVQYDHGSNVPEILPV